MEDLQKKVIKFRDERNWKQFHTSKDLALAICSEAGELADLFLWDRKPDKESIEDELADLIIFILSLSDIVQINLKKAINDKLIKNTIKYPIRQSYGIAKKYTEL